MKFPDMSSKNFTKLKFAAFFSVAVLLCVVIFSSFWSPNSSTHQEELELVPIPDVSSAGQLLEINQLLHSKWIQLELLYDERSLLMADPSKSNDNIQPGKQITEAEIAYAKILDSVFTNNAASPYVEKIDSVVNTFRVSLQNKQALNNNIIEFAVKNNGKTINVDAVDNKTPDQNLNKLQNELRSKTDLITKLEEQLKVTLIKSNSPVMDDRKLTEMQRELQAKTATIAKLQNQVKAVPSKVTNQGPQSTADIKKMQDELEFLKWALRSEVSANHALADNVTKLKQTNSNLSTQLKGK